MALKVPNEGELQLLEKMIRDHLSTNEDYILKLYKVNHTPDNPDSTANYTEATFTNYVPVTLARGTAWNAATTNGTLAEIQFGTQQSWTSGASGNTIFGYYVYGANAPNDLLWAEKFGTPRVLANQDVLNLTPKFTLESES
jgi:hypothetical protein